MTANELKRRASDLLPKIQAVVDHAEGENREMSADELSLIDGLKTQIEEFQKRAAKAEELEAFMAKVGRPEGRVSEPLSGQSEDGLEARSFEPVRGQSEGDKTRYFGDFLRSIALMSDKNVSHEERERAYNRITNVYKSRYRAWEGRPETRGLAATTSGSGGGYLVPTDFANFMAQMVGENSVVRPRATVIQVSGLSIDIPLLNQTAAPPTGGSAMFGGVSVKWTGEIESKPTTQPSFRQAKLDLHELSASCPVSRILLQKSSISLDGLLMDLFGKAVAWTEDYAFMTGTGGMRPKGFATALNTALVKTAARGSATAISFDNIVSCYVKMIASGQGAAIFLASQAAQAAVLKATGTAGTVFIPAGLVPISTDGVSNAGVGIGAFGRPILFTEKLPALNTLGDFGFYDLRQYIIGDSDMGMEIATSEHVNFMTNEVVFRVIKYVGGMPWLDAPFTLADGSTTVSPFVALEIQ